SDRWIESNKRPVFGCVFPMNKIFRSCYTGLIAPSQRFEIEGIIVATLIVQSWPTNILVRSVECAGNILPDFQVIGLHIAEGERLPSGIVRFVKKNKLVLSSADRCIIEKLIFRRL